MSDEGVRKEFADAVNMTASELDTWLQSEESKSSGQGKSAGSTKTSESTGHESGRRIVAILHKKKADITDADEQHMKKVVGYVKRHQKQRPSGDMQDSRWRYSLMNWGHDPLKK